MIKNPWFTLVIGLMVGLALGFVLAERQAIPPGAAVRQGATAEGGQAAGLPEGHPPVGEGAEGSQTAAIEQQIGELQGLLAQNPRDAGLMVALGDQYFELARVTGTAEYWQRAGSWYEEGMAHGRDGDPNVMTDLAVVYRNLGQQQKAIELLDGAIAADADHWQAWFNKVIVLNFDLHDHDGAREAFVRLEAIAGGNPQVPDLSRLRAEVMGE